MLDPDVLIIGAGPAGLAACVAAARDGARVLIVDQGKTLDKRDRDHGDDLIVGVGGAGLYSDGKFSFYPSATQLWRLVPKSTLQRSYHWMLDEMSHVGWNAHDEDIPETEPLETAMKTGRHEKVYPSYYATPAQRHALIERLSRVAGVNLINDTLVKDFSVSGEKISVTLLTSESTEVELLPRTVVIATGRFGPIMTKQWLTQGQQMFRRIEVGVRLEQPASEFFLRHNRNLDPKLLLDVKDGVSLRTFCCCRHGEIVTPRFNQIQSVSGRADGNPTDRSNVGLIVRINEPGFQDWDETLRRNLDSGVTLSASALDLAPGERSSRLARDLLGNVACDALWMGMEILRDYAQLRLDDNSMIHGPAIEGVGWYPRLEANLKSPAGPIWFAGDATGMFRGITAALVSGYFSGVQAASYLKDVGT